jgi:hypothetical protein
VNTNLSADGPAPHLVALVRAGVTFGNGKLAEWPAEDAA